MKKEELITGLALNSKFTAVELNDLLEVLGAIIQYALKNKTEVQLPGVGEFTTDADNNVVFAPDEELTRILKDPAAVVKIKNVIGLTNTDLWTGGRWVFKHNVNVC